jgi:hypothetical protein
MARPGAVQPDCAAVADTDRFEVFDLFDHPLGLAAGHRSSSYRAGGRRLGS